MMYVDPSQLPPASIDGQYPMYYLVRTPGVDGLLVDDDAKNTFDSPAASFLRGNNVD